MLVKIVNEKIKPEWLTPSTEGSAGIDLRVCIVEDTYIVPGVTVTARTGIAVAIPKGYVGLVFPRSGWGSKGLVLANSTGVIDSDYRGEIILMLKNTSNTCLEIFDLDRVAQLVVVPHLQYAIELVDQLDSTVRGDNGFGSTGTK